MRLRDLIAELGAETLTPEASLDVEIDRIYSTDRISDILSETTERTLLVTDLVNPQALRAGELVGVPAICFAGGKRPSAEDLEAAVRYGFETVLLVTAEDLSRARALLEARLAREVGKAQ